MQRTPFSPPQKSPELFHPRPQHISQVPMMRSPPPPVSQQSQQQSQVNSYGNPYQSPPGGGHNAGGTGFGPGFNFMNDPTAQMGFQVGQHAMKAGQEYMEQNVRLNPSRRYETCLKSKTRGSTSGRNTALTPSCTVEPLHLGVGIKTLLQRLQLVRRAEAPDRPVPLAP